MIVSGIKGTILGFENKTGTGKKSNQPYDFCVVSFCDEDFKVFNLNVAPDLVKKLTIPTLLKVKNKEVLATLNFYPKQFTVSAQLVDFKEAK